MEYKDYKINEFLDVLSSTKSMPGGGTASALICAYGISLALKVCNLTIGKEKYKEFESKVIEAREKLLDLNKKMLSFMDEDAKEFTVMEQVFKMPKNSDEEKKKRQVMMEIACKNCCKIPRVIIENAIEALKASTSLYGISNTSASSDLVTANIFLRAGIEGAWQNIVINLKYINDYAFRQDMDAFGKMVYRLIS